MIFVNGPNLDNLIVLCPSLGPIFDQFCSVLETFCPMRAVEDFTHHSLVMGRFWTGNSSSVQKYTLWTIMVSVHGPYMQFLILKLES